VEVFEGRLQGSVRQEGVGAFEVVIGIGNTVGYGAIPGKDNGTFERSLRRSKHNDSQRICVKSLPSLNRVDWGLETAAQLSSSNLPSIEDGHGG
jgi:hypothetical protein